VTGAITIHQTALHAALAELRDRGGEREDTAEAAAFMVDGLNVLTRLLDPYAAIGAAQRAAALPEGRARKLADDTDTAPSATAKAIEDLARWVDDHGACIGCGRVYHADRLRMCDGGEMHCPDCWPGNQKVGETLGTASVERADPAEQPRGTPEADAGAPEAGTPAPPTIVLPAEPGAASTAGEASAAEGASSPPLTPAPVQAAGGAIVHRAKARAPSGGGAPRAVWTEARERLLRDEGPTCRRWEDLVPRLNALDGEPVASGDAVRTKAQQIGVTRNAETLAAIAKEAGRKGGTATVTRNAVMPSPHRTDERIALFRSLWMDPALTVPTIFARINALDGPKLEASQTLYGWARKLGLPTARPMPEPAGAPVEQTEAAPSVNLHAPLDGSPAEPPSPPDEKAEAFDLFSAGSTVRDVHADLGTAISTLANWHAEWKSTRVRPQQQEARV
jgi:hypothetical protein